MKPSHIIRTTNAARLLWKNEPYATPETFLVAWVAWEQLKNRILYVGLIKQGWQGATIDQAIKGVEFWRKSNYNKAFSSIFGGHPEQNSAVSKVWREVEKGATLRDKFVHGMGAKRPAELATFTSRLFAVVEETSWCESLKVKLPNGSQVTLGSPMKRVVANKALQPTQSVTRLRAQLGLNQK